MIVSPVSRELVVSDVARSVLFYRDVLGFEASAGNAVVCGPAEVRFVAGESPSRSVVFFETSDVGGLRDSIVSRGRSPSAIERVNWIKMQMFEVRDPDGHVLWFGQSFHQPSIEMHTPPGRGQLRQMLPAMPHTNVASAIAHDRDVLGFTINYAQDDLGVMDRDSVTILLVARSEKHTGIGSCYVYVRDTDALHAELVAKGANVQGIPISHPWGLRDFQVIDLEGNEIRFGQTFE
jgi:catechol 2,3-dioxygenase-like lactoylglutathione lyase family enzyme